MSNVSIKVSLLVVKHGTFARTSVTFTVLFLLNGANRLHANISQSVELTNQSKQHNCVS